ncbi:MAG: hypothetical protein WDO13_16640 [Verrucomicrobiota bacterium]
MKLRLQSNSVRLRLKRAEVAALTKIGRVEEKIILGSGDDDVFTYVLELSQDAPAPRATLQKNRILVEVPVATATQWAAGDDVGISATVSVGGGRELAVLVEKDFACLNGPEEQNRDTFPNPLAGTKC